MPFESEKQRRYLHANEPEIAQRWEHEMKDSDDYTNPGGAYPGVENFNPGGEDAEMIRTIEGRGVHQVNGMSSNGITDNVNAYDGEYPDNLERDDL